MQSGERNTKPKLGKQEDGSELIRVSDDFVCRRGKHNFTYSSGTQAKCTKCPLGYPIGPRFMIKEGHIYKDYLLVI